MLDSAPEQEFDALVRAASLVCGVPISLISLIDAERQWFKANLGMDGMSETPRNLAFCAHAVLGDALFEVPDARLDPRFTDNPLVTGQPDIRFYAGAPIRLGDGSTVGTLCVIDRRPRELNDDQREVLRCLALVAARALEGRRAIRITQRAAMEAARTSLVVEHSADAIIGLTAARKIVRCNPAAQRLFGRAARDIVGQSLELLVPEPRRAQEMQAFLRLRGGVAATYDTERLGAGGQVVPVAVTLVPELDDAGRLLGATQFLRDVSERESALRLLAASEARFRALSDSSPHGVFHTDAHGMCTYTNQRWQHIYGLSAAESMGRGWSRTLHPDDRRRVFTEWNRAAAERDEFTIACRVRRDDATVRHVQSRVRAIFGADGQTLGFVGSVEDVTDHHALLERLAANEDHLRRLYEATPAMLHSIDAAGRLLTVSDAWLERLGYGRAQVIGQPSADFLTEVSRRYARETVLPAFFESGRCEQVEYQMLTRDGEVLDVLLSAILERDADGKPVRSLAVIEDMTLRRRAERALREERRRLANIIDGTAAGTWEWNVQTGEAHFNERWMQMIGRSAADLAPVSVLTWADHTHPEDLARSRALIAEHFAGRTERYELEVRMRHRDGHWVWVLACGRVLSWTADAKPEWMFGIHQDISARKRQEEALRISESRLGRTGRMAGVGGWEVDLGTGEVYWSDETCRIHGVAPGHRPLLAEATGFYTPEGRSAIRTAVESAAAGGPGFDLELALDRGGARTWLRAVGSVEFVEAGRPLRLVGTFQDVTERIAERLELRRANERVTLATDSGGIGIWECDLATGAIHWDARMHALWGRPGGDPARPIDPAWRTVHEEDRARVDSAFQAAVDGGPKYDTDFRVRWPDGGVRHLRGLATVVRDAQGRAVRLVGVNWDITESRRLAAELIAQHSLLRVTLQSIGDAVITTDGEGRINWLNPVAERMTGWRSAEASGRPLVQVFNIVNEATRAPTANPVEVCLSEGRTVGLANDTLLLSRDGAEYGIEDSAAPIVDEHGAVLGVVLVFHDVSEQRRLSGEMNFRATHDALTGLVNRVELEARLRRTLQKAGEDQSRHALLYIDLDQFKLVNDTCGHAVGDELLQQVARLFGEAVRGRDTLARLGGDEFAIILEHCTAEQAQRVAQQVCDRMDDFRFSHDGRRFRIGTSIGLVPIDTRWESTAAILQAADTSCYAAKEAGRNRVHTWFDTDATMRARHGEMEWTTRIEHALDEDRFVLHAQRIVALGEPPTGLHAEVLLRMVGADGALIPPGAFLPAAERFHLASRIDRWVLRRALHWMSGLASPGLIESLAVNLSGQSVSDRAFHRWALDLLAQTGADVCARLCLEITETEAVTNLADAALFIEQVRAIGVKVALDDFGAGASSFGYLKSMPVDFLKIDGQFIRDLVTDPLDEVAVRCFAEVAKVVGMKTVAEFVDHPELLTRLRVIGIDFAQGFLLHRPEPIDALLVGATARA